MAGLDRVALVLGSEGHGLSARWERSADRRAMIPMRRGIDSLNVAAAAAVACYVHAAGEISDRKRELPLLCARGVGGQPSEAPSWTTWCARCPTTRSSDSTRRARSPSWNLGAERVKGYTRRGGDRPQLRDVLHRGGPPRRAPADAADEGRARTVGSSTPAGGCARTAPGSGATSSSPRCTTTHGTAHRLRQGHPRPDRAARARGRAAPARSGCGCSSARSRTTRSSRSTPRAPSRPGTSAPSRSRATPPRRRSAAASRCSTPRTTAAPGCRCSC